MHYSKGHIYSLKKLSSMVNPINVVSDLMVLNVKNKFISITNAHFSTKVCVILLHTRSNIHTTKSALIIPVKRFVLQI